MLPDDLKKTADIIYTELSDRGFEASEDAVFVSSLETCIAGENTWPSDTFSAPVSGSDLIAAKMRSLLPPGSLNIENSDSPRLPGQLYQYYRASARRLSSAGGRRQKCRETQLFTPEWIARYLLENSLGRTLLAYMHTYVSDSVCAADFGWRYYLDGPDERVPVRIPDDLRKIRILDPCVGCGTILLSAFDMLLPVYEAAGWTEIDAAAAIIAYNLTGTDIDRQVCSLTRCALLMKAACYGAERNRCLPLLEETIRVCSSSVPGAGSLEDMPGLCESSYDIVVTNPPYMGKQRMDRRLLTFLKSSYPDSSSDLYAAFIERCRFLTAPGGFTALLTQQSWLFLKRYEKLRKKTANETTMLSLVQLGHHAFENVPGEVVQPVAFVLYGQIVPGYKTLFVCLPEAPSPAAKERLFRSGTYALYRRSLSSFAHFPGGAYLYRASADVCAAFVFHPSVSAYGTPRQGIATGNNTRYVRYWYEVPRDEIVSGCTTLEDFRSSNRKYVPYVKSGGYCRWYGNNLTVLRFDEPSYSQLKVSGNRLPSRPLFFHENVNWPLISTDLFPARYAPTGSICDVGSHAFYSKTDVCNMLGYMNTVVFNYFIKLVNPTMNYSSGSTAHIPCAGFPAGSDSLVRENVAISKQLWNLNELSSDFVLHPLVPDTVCGFSGLLFSNLLKRRITSYQALIGQLKKNTETLNRMYIGLYGLERELSPEVSERYLCVRKWTERDVVLSFVSYMVGCMFERYTACSAGHSVSMPDFITVDDMVHLFRQQLSLLYGQTALEENMKAVTSAISVKMCSPDKKLYAYFEKDFFTDHCRRYRGCPLYWLVGSGCTGGFRGYLYYHNFRGTTLHSIRDRYLSGSYIDPDWYRSALMQLAASGTELKRDDGIRQNYKKVRSVLYCPQDPESKDTPVAF